jgi:(4-(4-[2-(gamma-L-glutamylamino)ethyl]phenoxymethyl)furan-2-yl)methanamine synthase
MIIHVKKNQYYIGWDVGGAHLKAALINSSGLLLQVYQLPCALWKGLDQLEHAIRQVMFLFEEKHEVTEAVMHGVTMTGELVDLFENRQQGVLAISQMMQMQLAGNVLFYRASNDTQTNFVDYANVSLHWKSIASVNWHASAAFIAQFAQTGLLIDIGSTTTDLIRFRGGRVSCVGFTDAARMQFQELIYAGVIRTPLMAVTQSIAWGNSVTTVAAEYFATTADVFRLTGDLKPQDDMAETADGQDKSQLASARRIARMIGCDVEDATIEQWVALAHAFKTIQKQRLLEAIEGHLQLLMTLEPNLTQFNIIGAGVGCFLVKEIVDKLKDKRHVHFLTFARSDTLMDQYANNITNASNKRSTNEWASHCLPAVAVANFAFEYDQVGS